jgi:hypothetical protein
MELGFKYFNSGTFLKSLSLYAISVKLLIIAVAAINASGNFILNDLRILIVS